LGDIPLAIQRKLLLGESALGALKAQDYPGYMSELLNLLERAALPSNSDMHVNPGVLKSLEYAALKQLVGGHQGSRAELARKLGISEGSLHRKLKALA